VFIKPKMPKAVRIYTQLGCNPCAETEKYFAEHGVSTEIIIVDDLLKQAIPKELGMKEILTPITVCYTGENPQLVVGYNPQVFDVFINNSKNFKEPRYLGPPVIEGATLQEA